MARYRFIFVFLFLVVAAIRPQPVQAAGRAQVAPPYEVTVSITHSPNPAFVNQPVLVSVKVTPESGASGNPTGQVNILGGLEVLCAFSLNAAGEGSCTLTFADPATIPLRAVYIGAGDFLPDTSQDVVQTVIPRFPTTVQIASHTPFPSVLNQAVTVNLNLLSDNPSVTGNVTVYRGDSVCTSPPQIFTDRCAITLSDGSGSCSLPLSVAGEVTLCAAYSGDVGNLPSVGSVLHYVSSSNTALGIQSASPDPSLLNQPVEIYFTLTSPLGAPPSDGLVTVTSGNKSCSATLAVSHCPLVFDQPHINLVVATYPGAISNGLEFEPSTSNTWRQRVNVPPSDIRLSEDSFNSFLPVGVKIGTFSSLDANSDETHTYTLVQGEGAQHNSYFRMDGDLLVLARAAGSDGGKLSLRVRSTDSAGLWFEKSFTLRVIPGELPNTGFMPGSITRLPAQPAESRYFDMGKLHLEIPRLGMRTEIVGMPWNPDGWGAAWLGANAGWLDGTAYPSWRGNSVLVGHNYLADGTPGPFAQLSTLQWGDRIVVKAFGEISTFEVRAVDSLQPGDRSPLRHESSSWLTLITCQGYDQQLDAYRARIVVRAILVDIHTEKAGSK